MKILIKFLITFFIVLPGSLLVLCGGISILGILQNLLLGFQEIISRWQELMGYMIEIGLMIFMGFILIKVGNLWITRIDKK